MKIFKWSLPVLCILALASSLTACNLGVPAPQEPGYEEPFPEEPPMDEPHPEEPGFEEPHPEEPHPEEPHPEEPPHEEPPPPEPGPEEPPPPEPAPQQPQSGQPQSGPFTADLAVTDIYPGKQPYGQFHVRITNNGPGTLNKVKVSVSCSSERTDKNNGQLSSGGNENLNLNLSMKPGETQSFPTNLKLDTTVFDYLVGCEVHPGFNDPNPGNNVYSETLK
jgi:hypothetical protein